MTVDPPSTIIDVSGGKAARKEAKLGERLAGGLALSSLSISSNMQPAALSATARKVAASPAVCKGRQMIVKGRLIPFLAFVISLHEGGVRSVLSST